MHFKKKYLQYFEPLITYFVSCRRHGVSFHNPHVTEWYNSLIPMQVAEREKCRLMLYVITNTTRAVAAMVEVNLENIFLYFFSVVWPSVLYFCRMGLYCIYCGMVFFSVSIEAIFLIFSYLFFPLLFSGCILYWSWLPCGSVLAKTTA